MSRRELMDIIYKMKKNEQQMREEIACLQDELQNKRIRLSMAGSVAEAAAAVTNLFSAAQATADIYLQEISCMKEEAEKECAAKIEEANKAAEKIMSDGKKQLEELELHYQEELEKLQNPRKTAKTSKTRKRKK